MRDWTIRGLLFLVFAALILNAVLLAYAPGQAADTGAGGFRMMRGSESIFVLDTHTGNVKGWQHVTYGAGKEIWRKIELPE